MKTHTLLKTITVAGALAATLTLSACDMHISFGQEGQGQGQEQERGGGSAPDETGANPDDAGSPVAEEPAANATADSAGDETTSNSTTSNNSTSTGSSSSGGSTDSSSAASASDSGSSTSNGSSSSAGTTSNDDYQGPRIGEEGVELDLDGNGKIPADVLEEDIKHAYAKQGTTVDEVDCYSDLKIYDRRGSQSCTVTAGGRNHYGTVKITSASQSGIGYSLEFPDI